MHHLHWYFPTFTRSCAHHGAQENRELLPSTGWTWEPWIFKTMNNESRGRGHFFLARISLFNNVFFRPLRDILLIIYFFLGSKPLFLKAISPIIAHKDNATLMISSKNSESQEYGNFIFAQNILPSQLATLKKLICFLVCFIFLRCYTLLHVSECKVQIIRIHYI